MPAPQHLLHGTRVGRRSQLSGQNLKDEAVHVKELQAQRWVQLLQNHSLVLSDGRRCANIITDMRPWPDASQVSLQDVSPMFLEKVADAKDQGDHFLIHRCPHVSLSLARVFERVLQDKVGQFAREADRSNVTPSHGEQIVEVSFVGAWWRVESNVQRAHLLLDPEAHQRRGA